MCRPVPLPTGRKKGSEKAAVLQEGRGYLENFYRALPAYHWHWTGLYRRLQLCCILVPRRKGAYCLFGEKGELLPPFCLPVCMPASTITSDSHEEDDIEPAFYQGRRRNSQHFLYIRHYNMKENKIPCGLLPPLLPVSLFWRRKDHSFMPEENSWQIPYLSTAIPTDRDKLIRCS